MPQFKWRGVTLEGRWHKGISFAPTIQHLDNQLLRRGIACTQSAEYKTWVFSRSASYEQQAAICNRLAVLLQAGVRVPDAWILVAQHTQHTYLQEYLYAVGTTLQKGHTLHNALTQQKCPFAHIAVSLLQVGYESGKLADVVHALAQYLTTIHLFYKQMRAALYMPLITLLFVCLLIIAIFVYVVPYLLSLCSSCNTELPTSTHVLMQISTYMRSWYALLFVGIIAAFVCLIFFCIAYTQRGKQYWDRLLFTVPYIGPLVAEWHITLTMRALGALLESNMTIAQALHTIYQVHAHTIVKQECMYVAHLVESGTSLSDALAATHSGIFQPDLIAMIAIGEESNKLPEFLHKTASIYHDRLAHKLQRLATLIQPLMIILLGIIVMILIISVYLPIIHMAQQIQ